MKEDRGGALGWQVVDANNLCRAPIAFMIEEAEAKIIEFALNAVVDGRRLIAATPVAPDTTEFDMSLVSYYDGPTEGVAP